MGSGNDCLTLYIRLPIKIRDEYQIKELHPLIQEVRIPRQKSRRWCLASFESVEELNLVRKGLKKIYFDGKSIKVSLYKKNTPKLRQEKLTEKLKEDISNESLLQLLDNFN